jgi:hypothetical protein
MLCACGCGQPTNIATFTNTKLGHVAGQPYPYRKGHRSASGRHPRKEPGTGSLVLRHRARAERALGKPLPAAAHVHHADGSKNEDAPLVICQDAAYHNLLHVRMRVLRAGGNPNTDRVCSTCRRVKAISEFFPKQNSMTGVQGACKLCSRAASLRSYHRHKTRRVS